MIAMDMRQYDYLLYGEDDAYGAPTLSGEVKGSIKLAIYTNSMTVTDSVKYSEGDYVALTRAPITDNYVIIYGEKRLKVLYVIPTRTYTQVFLKEI